MTARGTHGLSIDGILGSLGLDAYQRAAQLYPAMLTILAPLVTVLFWLPAEAKVVSSLVSVAASAALLVLLMQYGRSKGRAVQARMVRRNGGLESTMALRHRDTRLAGPSRQRYHEFLASHGKVMPTATEEAADPEAADGHYRAAMDWLREKTRDPRKFHLLQGENRSYGFRRNLLGMKALGATLTAISLAADVAGIWLLGGAADHRISAGLLGILLACGLWAWLFVVTDGFVEDASWAYTTRLLSACDTLPRGRHVKKS